MTIKNYIPYEETLQYYYIVEMTLQIYESIGRVYVKMDSNKHGRNILKKASFKNYNTEDFIADFELNEQDGEFTFAFSKTTSIGVTPVGGEATRKEMDSMITGIQIIGQYEGWNERDYAFGKIAEEIAEIKLIYGYEKEETNENNGNI